MEIAISVDDDAAHRWSRWLVAVACVTPVPALVWTSVHHAGFAVVLAVLLPVPAVPLLLAQSRRAFRAVCLVLGTLLIVGGICGVMFGFVVYAPAGVILLVAPFADPRLGRRLARGVLAVGAVAAVVTVAGWSYAIYYSAFRPPHLLEVHTSSAFWHQPGLKDLINYSGSGIGYGASYVSLPSAPPTSLIEVSYRDDLTHGEVQRLKGHLLTMPGVVSVTVCGARWIGDPCSS